MPIYTDVCILSTFPSSVKKKITGILLGWDAVMSLILKPWYLSRGHAALAHWKVRPSECRVFDRNLTEHKLVKTVYGETEHAMNIVVQQMSSVRLELDSIQDLHLSITQYEFYIRVGFVTNACLQVYTIHTVYTGVSRQEKGSWLLSIPTTRLFKIFSLFGNCLINFSYTYFRTRLLSLFLKTCDLTNRFRFKFNNLYVLIWESYKVIHGRVLQVN